MAHLLPPPIFKAFDANGLPLVGGKLYTYIATTSTPQATYTDETEGTANTNPQILDANGEAVVWLGVGKSYKIILKDSSDVVQWTRDNVTHIGVGEIVTTMLANGILTADAAGRAKMADGYLTTAKLVDASVTTAKLVDGSVTPAKIPDNSITMAKLTGSTELGFKDSSDGRYGGGPRAFPVIPWSTPGLIANPSSLPGGDGKCVAWSPNDQLLAFAENSAGYASLFSRLGAVLTKFAGLDNFPASGSVGVAWSPDGQYLVVIGSVVLKLYQRTGGNFAQIALTGTAGTANGAAWSPSGEFIAIAHATSPFVSIYQRTIVYPTAAVLRAASNNGQSIANNTIQIVNFEDSLHDNAGAGSGSWQFTAQRSNGYTFNARVTFASSSTGFYKLFLYKNGSLYSALDFKNIFADDGSELSLQGSDWVPLTKNDTVDIRVIQNAGGSLALVTDDAYNYVTAVEDPAFNELALFTKLSNPGSLPANTGQCAAWSPDSQFLAIGHTTTPFVTIYQRTGATFAKCADPVSLPAAQVNGVAWSPDGTILTCVHGTTPFITNYSRSGVTFTKMTAPVTLPAGAGNGAQWSPNGGMLAVAHDTSPYITIYTWDGATFTKLTDPVDLPAGNAKSVSWTSNGQYLAVAHTTTPFLTTYKSIGTVGTSVVLFVKEVDLV